MFKKQTLVAAISFSTLAAALAGCVAQETDSRDNSPIANSSDEQNSDSSTPNTSSENIPAGLLADATTAIDTALAQTAGAAIELDFEEDSRVWNVTVAQLEAGTETGITISLDGSTIISTDVAEPLDTDDAELAAKIKFSLQEALLAVPESLRGYIEDVSLESLGGTPMWKLSIIPEGKKLPRRLLIDATNGSIS